jgi:hypothetical protein
MKEDHIIYDVFANPRRLFQNSSLFCKAAPTKEPFQNNVLKSLKYIINKNIFFLIALK